MTSAVQYAQATASLQPPPTQNTAPVIEHRCLYTQDLRRKAKRWHDGVLRFHTFNKRVMVSDVPRNFIGDTHWREDYPIQDGDELELERPVLVQVGEQVGSVDQDLTELFNKKNRKNAVSEKGPGKYSSSPPVPLRSSGLRTNNVVATQLVPKSLNALLGTPKGRIGRAKLPTKSPYELRIANDVAGRVAEPQAKRQRIEFTAHRTQQAPKSRASSTRACDVSEKENGQTVDRVYESITPAIRNTERSQAPRPTSLYPPLSKSDARVAVSLDGGVETTRSNLTNLFSDEGGIGMNRLAAKGDRACQPQQGKARKTERRTNHSTSVQTAPKLVANPQAHEPSYIINIPSDTEISFTRSDKQNSPNIRLQLASRKPRRKLMYRDLLPPDAIAAKDTSRRSRGDVSDTEHQAQSASNPQLDQRDGLEKTRQNYKRVRRKSGERVPSSADDGYEDGESAQRILNPAVSEYENESPNELVTEALDEPWSQSPDIAQPSIPRSAPSLHNTNTVLAQMDEILLSRSQVPVPTLTKQRSPFRKSNSDMPRSTIARSASDITKSSPITGAPSEVQEQKISPWSREAWDLFGCGRDGQAVDFATFCMNEDV